MKTIKNLLLLSILIYSCDSISTNKTYDYTEYILKAGETSINEKDPETITAKSDSLAFIEAYEKYCISKKASKQAAEVMGTEANEVISFSLVNSDGIDISQIDFIGKDSIITEIEATISSLNSGITKHKNKKDYQIDSSKIAELDKYFNISEDEFDENKRKWYTPKSATKYIDRNDIYCYFQMNKEYASNFRLRLQYYADDWLFFDKCIFSIDGEVFNYYPSDTKTDNGNGGYIWEWFDEQITSSNESLIKTLAYSKEAKVKLIGPQYHKVKSISSKQILNIKRSYELYKAMGGTF